MIKQMNWGKGIVMGMAIFMLFILSMCIYMFNVPVDDYDHQYYEKGMSFNKDHNLEEQVIKDHAEPVMTQQGDQLNIAFGKPVTGWISFMRPSDKTQDKTFELNSGAGNTTNIVLQGIVKGPWQLTLEWESDRKAYLYHKEVFIK